MQDATRVETSAFVIAAINKRVRFGRQTAHLPVAHLMVANNGKHYKKNERADDPEQDLEKSSLAFIMNLFQFDQAFLNRVKVQTTFACSDALVFWIRQAVAMPAHIPLCSITARHLLKRVRFR